MSRNKMLNPPRPDFEQCLCGAWFVTRYNGETCPDCNWANRNPRLLSSLGREDLVQHFSQAPGLRLQRAQWVHFK